MKTQTPDFSASSGLVPMSTYEATAIRAVIADARAPSTRRVYRSDVDRYVLWATDRGIAPFPTSPEIVMRHVIFLVDDQKKISSIDRALVALALAQRMAGGTDFRTDSTFREFIKGLRRSLRDQPQKRAPPVLQDALRQLVSVFAEPTALHARNRAILIIGWFGAMRRSEIVALDRDDVRETKDGLVVTIRHSKTDQTGRGQVLGLPRRDDALCPVAAVRAWLAVADAAAAPQASSTTRGGPLFVAFSNRCRGQRLKPQAVELVMAEALAHTGLADAFTPHSLRAGFATAAARAGKPIFAIQRQTRHKSIQMLERYVREGEVFSQNAAGGL